MANLPAALSFKILIQTLSFWPPNEVKEYSIQIDQHMPSLD